MSNAIVTERDELSKDLDKIVIESEGNYDQLMIKLVSYITRRDHRVFNHAYQLGLKRGKEISGDGDIQGFTKKD